MTTIEAPTETHEAISPDASTPDADDGLLSLLTTTDHKMLGMMYVRLSMLFGVAILGIGAVVGIERSQPDSIDLFGSVDQFFQAWTAYRVGLVFLVVVPLFLGLATAIVPLQVGSPAIAFPRAAALGFWCWTLGAGIVLAGFAIDGGVGTPFDRSDSEAVALTLAALVLTVIGLGLSTVCVVTTVIALRPEGMYLDRVPVFAWSMVIAGVTWLVAFGVFIGNLVLAYVDLRGRAPVLYGQEQNIFGQIQWMFAAPQVLAFAIPAFGIAGDAIATSTNQRQPRYGVLLGGIGALGVLTFGAWAQRAFQPSNQNLTENGVYVAQGILTALAMLVILGGFASAIVGSIRNIGRPNAWFIGAVAGLLMVTIAGDANVLRVIEPLDLIDTSAETSVMNYALIGALIAGVAGVYYWAPKFLGRKLSGGVGSLAMLGLLGGTIALALPDLISGFLGEGQPEFVLLGYEPESSVESLNVIAMIGAFVVAGAFALAFLDMLAASARSSEVDLADDPWGGQTLEWATTSPPPLGNFAAPVATVRSPQPLLDDEAPATDDGTEAN